MGGQQGVSLNGIVSDGPTIDVKPAKLDLSKMQAAAAAAPAAAAGSAQVLAQQPAPTATATPAATPPIAQPCAQVMCVCVCVCVCVFCFVGFHVMDLIIIATRPHMNNLYLHQLNPDH